MVKVDLSGVTPFINERELYDHTKTKAAHDLLQSGSGMGAEYTGWIQLPELRDLRELARIKTAASKIKNHSEALVVIGIGGSYLGARAVIELLRSPNYNLLPKSTPDIFFVGNNLSSNAILEILTLVKDRNFSVNVISKSGTTTEPAVAFRIFKKLLEEKYGTEGAKQRVFATTSKSNGALRKLSEREGYETFIIPDDIGGRYSVLTAVGLLPIAVAGIDIDLLLEGAGAEMRMLREKSGENPAWQYANARQRLYTMGKKMEILSSFEPYFRYMGEWWKQLFGESEGKNGIGIFPATAEFTADLHSLGQYIQDGERTLLETIVSFENAPSELFIPFDPSDDDGLNYLSGLDFGYVNAQAQIATKAAHIKGGVPVIEIDAGKISEGNVGALIYFFQMSCGISGYVSGVNPFDQQGVDEYKRNMFALLGKPGYEDVLNRFMNV